MTTKNILSKLKEDPRVLSARKWSREFGGGASITLKPGFTHPEGHIIHRTNVREFSAVLEAVK